MHLKKLQLYNFKNFGEINLELHPKINFFVGNNGVGKTNLMDAIYYLSFCKSFHNSFENNNIKHNEDFFAIHGTYDDINSQDNVLISCSLRSGSRKIFKFNKKEYQRLADHIGLIPLVIISPYDADLINLGSEFRRRYFDSVISQFDKLYLDDLVNYNRVLQQRNVLLKTMFEQHRFDGESLKIWDFQMSELGQRINQRRIKFLGNLKPIFQEYYNFLTNGKEKVEIEYQSQANDKNYFDELVQNHEKDKFAQYSTFGIHKDDYIFKMNDFPIKRYGSQGQQKSFLIALKLAQFSHTYNISKTKPLLLLDDIFDKLDENRVLQIIALAGEGKLGQVFISDTHLDRIESLFAKLELSYSCFDIKNGNIIQLV